MSEEAIHVPDARSLVEGASGEVHAVEVYEGEGVAVALGMVDIGEVAWREIFVDDPRGMEISQEAG